MKDSRRSFISKLGLSVLGLGMAKVLPAKESEELPIGMSKPEECHIAPLVRPILTHSPCSFDPRKGQPSWPFYGRRYTFDPDGKQRWMESEKDVELRYQRWIAGGSVEFFLKWLGLEGLMGTMGYHVYLFEFYESISLDRVFRYPNTRGYGGPHSPVFHDVMKILGNNLEHGMLLRKVTITSTSDPQSLKAKIYVKSYKAMFNHEQ